MYRSRFERECQRGFKYQKTLGLKHLSHPGTESVKRERAGTRGTSKGPDSGENMTKLGKDFRKGHPELGKEVGWKGSKGYTVPAERGNSGKQVRHCLFGGIVLCLAGGGGGPTLRAAGWVICSDL